MLVNLVNLLKLHLLAATEPDDHKTIFPRHFLRFCWRHAPGQHDPR